VCHPLPETDSGAGFEEKGRAEVKPQTPGAARNQHIKERIGHVIAKATTDLAGRIPPLIAGPYHPPKLRLGAIVTCLVRGEIEFCGWSDAPIEWPLGRRPGTQYPGRQIVTDELARAIRTESNRAVCYWWGLSHTTVSTWRRKLGAEVITDGTFELIKQASMKHRRRLAQAKRRRTQ
jgi:hypothetical protein